MIFPPILHQRKDIHMAQKNVTRDMTQGSPLKLILTFSLPLLGGFLFQQLYSFMDTMVVGGVLGTEALAAVGDTGSLNFLINGFCMASAPASRFRLRRRSARRTRRKCAAM